MQSHKQNRPAEEHESIQYYMFEGLFPATHVFALNLALGTFLHLHQDEQTPYPLVLGEHKRTGRERDLLRPLLVHCPQWVPYEIIHLSLYQGYDHLSTQRITQAQARLDLLRKEKLWDAELRPIRNVMARLRLNLREVSLETITMLETGYLLIKNPKWRSPLEQYSNAEQEQEEEQREQSVEKPGTSRSPLKMHRRQHQRSAGEPQRRASTHETA